ncbi:MAG: hypothetical protein Q9165_000943 [Trypethelium subeluteriae]
MIMPSKTDSKDEKSGLGNANGNSTPTIVQHYGGNSKDGWLAYLPDSWLPYVQLARLSPPAGLFLTYFSHVFGVLHAAITLRAEPSAVAKGAGIIFGGSFFVSNALHIWNDLIDAPLDALVERTRHRPIPRGAISRSAAMVFTATQALGAAVFLFYLPVEPLDAFLYSIPGIIAWAYYPFAKRHTNAPQVVVGVSLAWGVVMGSVGLGGRPFNIGLLDGSKPYVDLSALCLFLAVVAWSVIFDTIYAYQDVEDDIKAGIKSLAVLFRDQPKLLLWPLFTLMAALLVECGRLGNMGTAYYGVAVGGSMLSLGLMVALVDLTDAVSCWWWFGNGFWYAGGFIIGGLLLEYVVDVVI